MILNLIKITEVVTTSLKKCQHPWTISKKNQNANNLIKIMNNILKISPGCINIIIIFTTKNCQLIRSYQKKRKNMKITLESSFILYMLNYVVFRKLFGYFWSPHTVHSVIVYCVIVVTKNQPKNLWIILLCDYQNFENKNFDGICSGGSSMLKKYLYWVI